MGTQLVQATECPCRLSHAVECRGLRHVVDTNIKMKKLFKKGLLLCHNSNANPNKGRVLPPFVQCQPKHSLCPGPCSPHGSLKKMNVNHSEGIGHKYLQQPSKHNSIKPNKGDPNSRVKRTTN